ncbi:DNA-processing protein DprA [Microbacterium ulmi]|nr:DNA-processing protein DprA [Microbacterium ulmi]
MNRTEKAALLALLYHQSRRASQPELRQAILDGERLADRLEGADGLFAASPAEDALTRAKADLAGWEAAGLHVLTPLDEEYPAQLFTVHDFPLVLFGRGQVESDFRSAAIVGSRNYSQGGQQYADELAARLVAAQVTVVSGLAKGIDITAHRSVLQAGGRTVAVLGNGLDHAYPAEHPGTQEEIGRTGLLLSQFRPATRPSKQSFPQRNVTMSAYSSVTVIVEAQEASGTRIQARAAIGHARPLVLSEQVVQATSWGKEFAAGSYDVTVAPSPADAAAAVGDILARATRPLSLVP